MKTQKLNQIKPNKTPMNLRAAGAGGVSSLKNRCVRRYGQTPNLNLSSTISQDQPVDQTMTSGPVEVASLAGRSVHSLAVQIEV
jgi:hypothetical protein